MLARNGIEGVPISVRNPQANSVMERMHKTVNDMLQTMVRQPVADVGTALDFVDNCIASTQRAIRSIAHRTLQTSPGALVFHRDMMLPIPLVADYNMIRDRRQAVIDSNAMRESRRRRFVDYQVGDQVLEILKPLAKLGLRSRGPYQILQTHTNGTVTVQKGPNVTERMNIRRIKPYKQR